MAIDPSLLIAAPILQDYFVDKTTGDPLSGGIVTLYQDNNRTTLKNWYYQTGAPGAYSYLPLPNPATLSDVGTIEDANGNDTIPFFYPYSETDNSTKQPYYITVDNSSGQRQFTRQNFPFNPGTQTGNVNATNDNLIINNEFWRNIGSLNATTLTNAFLLNGVTTYYATIAPSQHDGFTDMSDIQFIKDANGAADTITFENFVANFPNQVLPDSVTPEYYLNIVCSGTGPETVKYVQVPIQLHVDSLSGVTNCSVTICAMANTGSPQMTLGIFQFLGSGVTSPGVSILETIVLSSDWQKYTITFTMPSAQGLTLGNGGDDALYLQVGLPAASVFDINIAVPGTYLALEPPTNDFKTYDQINSIISSPRTGDIRTSLNAFYPYGWVPMSDGTIGNPDSNATARANKDTWPLYELLWNSFNVYTSGSVNLLAQMVDSSGSNVAYGGNAISDFNANNAITLTKSMGQVLLGTVPVSALLNTYATTFTAETDPDLSGKLLLTTANNVNFFNGMPIYFSNSGGALPTGLSANTIYYVADFNGTASFHVATSFANAMAGTVVMWTDDGSGTNTVKSALPGSYEGEYAHTQLDAEVGSHVHLPSPGGQEFVCSQPSGNIYTGDGGLGTLYTTTGDISRSGSQTAFNVTQPGTFLNIFMKL